MLMQLGTEDVCTAVITSHMEDGENFDGAIVIGCYREHMNEVWLRFGDGMINVQLDDVDVLCKQLKRAAKMCREQK